MNGFPQRRLRRLRRSAAVRSLARETQVTPEQLIQPLFVVEDPAAAGPIAALPGVVRHTLTELPKRIEQIGSAGVPAVLLFGIPQRKSPAADAARDADGIVPRAVRACRSAGRDLAIITDVCVCSYTDHGHCGIVKGETVDNDASLELLAATAVAHARAGADFVAPSAMMDGQVAALRRGLDAAGLVETGILSYAVKYASCFYGPFREAADSAPGFGDRRGYQMDPANRREALAEAALDVAEGADALMVKPALAYLDVISAVKNRFSDLPLAAYQVSGEYAMIAAAAANGWLDERRAALETLTAIRRAGADWIITYYAERIRGWLAG